MPSLTNDPYCRGRVSSASPPNCSTDCSADDNHVCPGTMCQYVIDPRTGMGSWGGPCGGYTPTPVPYPTGPLPPTHPPALPLPTDPQGNPINNVGPVQLPNVPPGTQCMPGTAPTGRGVTSCVTGLNRKLVDRSTWCSYYPPGESGQYITASTDPCLTGQPAKGAPASAPFLPPLQPGQPAEGVAATQPNGTTGVDALDFTMLPWLEVPDGAVGLAEQANASHCCGVAAETLDRLTDSIRDAILAVAQPAANYVNEFTAVNVGDLQRVIDDTSNVVQGVCDKYCQTINKTLDEAVGYAAALGVPSPDQSDFETIAAGRTIAPLVTAPDGLGGVAFTRGRYFPQIGDPYFPLGPLPNGPLVPPQFPDQRPPLQPESPQLRPPVAFPANPPGPGGNPVPSAIPCAEGDPTCDPNAVFPESPEPPLAGPPNNVPQLPPNAGPQQPPAPVVPQFPPGGTLNPVVPQVIPPGFIVVVGPAGVPQLVPQPAGNLANNPNQPPGGTLDNNPAKPQGCGPPAVVPPGCTVPTTPQQGGPGFPPGGTLNNQPKPGNTLNNQQLPQGTLLTTPLGTAWQSPVSMSTDDTPPTDPPGTYAINWCGPNPCGELADASLYGGGVTTLEQDSEALKAFLLKKVNDAAHSFTYASLFLTVPAYLLTYLAGIIADGSVKIVQYATTLSGCASNGFAFLMLKRTLLGPFRLIAPAVIGDLDSRLERTTNALCPPNPPDSGAAIAAYLAGQIDERTMRCYLRANGVCDTPMIPVIRGMRTRPGVPETVSLWRRGKLNDAQFQDQLRNLGVLDNVDKQQYVDATDYIPGPGDVVQFMLRDVADPAAVAKYQMDVDFDAKFQGDLKTYAKASGISDTVMKYYWRQHWKLPSPGELYQMLYRLRPGKPGVNNPVTQEDVKAALQLDDYLPYYNDRLIDISYRVFGVRDLKRLYVNGVFKEADLKSAFMDSGYKDADADKLAKALVKETARQRAKNSGTLPENTVLKLYKDGSMTSKEATGVLKDYGYDDAAANQLLDNADLQSAAELRGKQVSAAKKKFLLGEWSDGSATSQLVSIGVDGSRATQIVAAWKVELNLRSKTIAPSILCGWLARGLINSGQYMTRMQNLGYNDVDAYNYVTKCVLDDTEKRAKEVQAAIKQSQADAEKASKKAAAERKARARCTPPAKPKCQPGETP